jgi:hypothetical protein
MDRLDLTIDADTSTITICNNHVFTRSCFPIRWQGQGRTERPGHQTGHCDADLQRFGVMCLGRDTIAPLTSRMYDITGCLPAVHVTLNNRPIKLMASRPCAKAPPELTLARGEATQASLAAPDLLQQLGLLAITHPRKHPL